jgi:AcrR family transcriptional regulator
VQPPSIVASPAHPWYSDMRVTARDYDNASMCSYLSRGHDKNLQDKTPRRQERGKKRMAELLRAAGEVFADVGYENATTNAIAARAGVSPGTLYQFFPNKEALAEALANAYAAKNQALHDSFFDLSAAEVPLRDLIDRLDWFVSGISPEFPWLRNAYLSESVVSRELAERVQALDKQMKQRIADLIQMRAPHVSAKTIQTAAETSLQIVKGLLPLALDGSAKQREVGERELKLVLERYLAPLERVESASAKTPRTTRTR